MAVSGSTRRKGRELALQVLYQLEMGGGGPEQALRNFADSFEHSPKAHDFGADLVRGVLARREEIDRLIAGVSEHWRLDRLSRIDGNVIRIAVYEMTADPPLPMEIAINEAIEVVKKYGTADSAAFVNGILDELAKRLGLQRSTPRAPSP
jgi:N utilization substance protein B